MDLKMGSQTFKNVEIPLLWGTRAVIQDINGRLSVIDLSGDSAKLEILGDKPAPGVEFLPALDGFQILTDGKPLYSYNPSEKILINISLELPDCQIGRWETKVGSNIFSNNMIVGFPLGIAVTKDGIAMGGPLPSNLAKLMI